MIIDSGVEHHMMTKNRKSNITLALIQCKTAFYSSTCEDICPFRGPVSPELQGGAQPSHSLVPDKSLI